MSQELQQEPAAIDSPREIEILKFLQRCAQEDPYWNALMDSYSNIVQGVIRSQLEVDSKKFGSRAAYMTGLSGIATLLAGAQIAFVQVVGAAPICASSDECGPHSALLLKIIIFSTYISLSFEIIGALSSLLTAKRLVDLSTRARGLMETKSTLEKLIAKQMRPEASNSRTKELMACRTNMGALFEAIESHVHDKKHSSSGLQSVILLILLGMVCFFAALIFEVVMSQPKELWIAFILCLALMGLVLVWIEKRAHPRLWRALRAPRDDEESAIETREFNLHESVKVSLTRDRLHLILNDPDPEVSRLGLEIVGQAQYDGFYAGNDRLLRQLIQGLGDVDVNLRIAALRTASHFVHDAAVRAQISTGRTSEEILLMVSDQQSNVRRSALEIIVALAEHADVRNRVFTPEIRQGIIATLVDKDFSLREPALKAINSLAYNAAALELKQRILEMLNDPQDIVRRTSLEIMSPLSQHVHLRPAVSTQEIVESIVSTAIDPGSGLRELALKAIASLMRHADVHWRTFEQQAIKQIASMAATEDREVQHAVLTILSALARRGRIVAPTSIILEANPVPGAEAQQLLKDIISSHGSVSWISDSLLRATLENLEHAASDVRESYTDIIRMLPWTNIMLSPNTTKKLVALLYQPKSEIVESTIQIMGYCSENVEFRQNILNNHSNVFVALLNNKQDQALILITKFAKYVDTREAISDLNSGLVRELLIMFNNEQEQKRWQISVKCLLALGLI
ncbi:armadillo-type protein [Mycena leptocephala]|nr:armadillo-type protein [Mycena leptocephala]